MPAGTLSKCRKRTVIKNHEVFLTKTIAIVTQCPNKRMTGRELRRLRIAADLSEAQVAAKFGTYRRQIQRWEKKGWFELVPTAMQQLLNILGVSYE